MVVSDFWTRLDRYANDGSAAVADRPVGAAGQRVAPLAGAQLAPRDGAGVLLPGRRRHLPAYAVRPPRPRRPACRPARRRRRCSCWARRLRRADRLAARHVPQLERAVGAAADQRTAARRERQRGDAPGMAFEAGPADAQSSWTRTGSFRCRAPWRAACRRARRRPSGPRRRWGGRRPGGRCARRGSGWGVVTRRPPTAGRSARRRARRPGPGSARASARGADVPDPCLALSFSLVRGRRPAGGRGARTRALERAGRQAAQFAGRAQRARVPERDAPAAPVTASSRPSGLNRPRRHSRRARGSAQAVPACACPTGSPCRPSG